MTSNNKYINSYQSNSRSKSQKKVEKLQIKIKWYSKRPPASVSIFQRFIFLNFLSTVPLFHHQPLHVEHHTENFYA